MKIHLGLSFDESVYPDLPKGTNSLWNEIFVGEKGFISILETHLGINFPEIPEYKRVISLSEFLNENQNLLGVFGKSFDTDSIATSKLILKLRDELLLAEWDFSKGKDISPKLDALSDIHKNACILTGYADRFEHIIKKLPNDQIPFKEIVLYHDHDLFPGYIKRLVSLISDSGIKVNQKHAGIIEETNGKDIDLVYDVLNDKKFEGKQSFKKDGTFQIVKGLDNHINARYLSSLIEANKGYCPVLVDNNNDIQIHGCLTGYHIPSSGYRQMSDLAIPVQFLKIIFNLFWSPVNPYHIMEFLGMKLNPFSERFRLELAKVLSNLPGKGSDKWNEVIEKELNKIEAKKKKKEFQRRVRLLLESASYSKVEGIPVSFIREVLNLLSEWARKQMKLSDPAAKSRARSCSHIYFLISALIEFLLNYKSEDLLPEIGWERILNEISTGYSLGNHPAEINSISKINNGFCIYESSEDAIWWNCVHDPIKSPLENLHLEERQYLEKRGIGIQIKKDVLELRNQSLKNLFIHSNNLLIFVPAFINGKKTNRHLLLARLEAIVENMDDITIDLSREMSKAPAGLTLNGLNSIKQVSLPNYPKKWELAASIEFDKRKEESFTSLEKLVYYPHEYFFSHVAGIRKYTSFSLNNEELLNGNLAHEIIERIIIEKNFQNFDSKKLSALTDNLGEEILPKMGSHLLIQGKENEKRQFFTIIKKAVLGLQKVIIKNSFRIDENLIEKEYSTPFDGEVRLVGRTDLVLLDSNNAKVIIDLKWGGLTVRQKKVKDSNDLQLPIYARLVDPANALVPTAYFIIKSNQIITRFPDVFKSAQSFKIADDDPNQLKIIEMLTDSYRNRMDEFNSGIIEVGEDVLLTELPSSNWKNGLSMPENRGKKVIDKYSDYNTFIKLD